MDLAVGFALDADLLTMTTDGHFRMGTMMLR